VSLSGLQESDVEQAALEWFHELGYRTIYGPHLAPNEPSSERVSFGEVVLVGRLRDAIQRLKSQIQPETETALLGEEALDLQIIKSQDLLSSFRAHPQAYSTDAFIPSLVYPELRRQLLPMSSFACFRKDIIRLLGSVASCSQEGSANVCPLRERFSCTRVPRVRWSACSIPSARPR